MSKTSSVFVRVEPQVKEQAEAVLSQLGIPMSSAIALFLKQVVLQRGIPFQMKLPEAKPLAYGSMSDADFNAVMEKCVADYAAGNVTTAEDVRAEMRRGFGL